MTFPIDDDDLTALASLSAGDAPINVSPSLMRSILARLRASTPPPLALSAGESGEEEQVAKIRDFIESQHWMEPGTISKDGFAKLARDLLTILDTRAARFAEVVRLAEDLHGALDDCVDAMVESATQCIATKSCGKALDRAESVFAAYRAQFPAPAKEKPKRG